MSDIIRAGQRGGLVPVLDPRLRAITEEALAEQEAREKFDQMLISKTGMRTGPSEPLPQRYAFQNKGAYASDYSADAADAYAVKRRMDHLNAEERAAVDMTGDSGPAPSPYRGIAPRYTLERQEQDLEQAAVNSQSELGDMLAEQQEIQVPEPPADYFPAKSPEIDESKFADMFKRQYLAREDRRQTNADRERVAQMARDVAPMDTTGRAGPLPELPTEQELAAGIGNAARDGRPSIEDRDMTPEELAGRFPSSPTPQARRWIDSTGKHATVGTLVKYENGEAHIKKQGGGVVKVPLAKLSRADQDLIDPNARNARTQQVAAKAVAQPAAPPAPVKPQLEAGPEVLKPGPGELQEGQPEAAQAKAQPVPVPASPQLRERYLGTVWPQIKQIADARGVDQNLLRDVYDMAAEQGGHRAGIKAIQSQVANLRTEAVAGAQTLQRERLLEDAQARRMGVSPQAFQNYKSIRQSNPEDLVAHLSMMHMQYPQHGFGNLLALHMKNMANNEQAQNLNQGNQDLLPADRERENLDRALQQGAGPGLIASLINHYRNTPDGKANPGGAMKFAIDASTPTFQALHERADIKPDEHVFVQQYVRSFPNYQAFKTQAGIQDTPATREWYTRITGREASTYAERLRGALTDAASGASDFGNAAWEWGKEQFFGKPKPSPESVAAEEKKKRREGVFNK